MPNEAALMATPRMARFMDHGSGLKDSPLTALMRECITTPCRTGFVDPAAIYAGAVPTQEPIDLFDPHSALDTEQRRASPARSHRLYQHPRQPQQHGQQRGSPSWLDSADTLVPYESGHFSDVFDEIHQSKQHRPPSSSARVSPRKALSARDVNQPVRSRQSLAASGKLTEKLVLSARPSTAAAAAVVEPAALSHIPPTTPPVQRNLAANLNDLKSAFDALKLEHDGLKQELARARAEARREIDGMRLEKERAEGLQSDLRDELQATLTRMRADGEASRVEIEHLKAELSTLQTCVKEADATAQAVAERHAVEAEVSSATTEDLRRLAELLAFEVELFRDEAQR
ncbi:hypothetical protein PYCC9005_000898 [Savitreella phatthalungensis]